MELSPTALVIIGLLLAAWTIGAAWAILAARAQVRRANSARKATRRLAQMIEDCPAVPVLVRADGKIEAPERLASWLGLDAVPAFLSELESRTGGLVEADLAQLQQAVKRTQKTAAPFQMAVTPRGSSQRLLVRGQHADPAISAAGAALVWFFSEEGGELARLRTDLARVRKDAALLRAVIEAAPVPLWLRGPDTRLKLVNPAFADLVGADDVDQVIAEQVELEARPFLRTGEVLLDEDGSAGFAVDHSEAEQQTGALHRLHQAQQAILERLSTPVARFDGDQSLVFANSAFQRTFGLPTGRGEAVDFGRVLEAARQAERVPPMRDYSAWTRRLTDWFAAHGAQEDVWRLTDGSQLRILGQPMPDGGLVMVAEERIQGAAPPARNRTAILDNLLESLAVFAPDGHLLLWNRPFPALWHLPDRTLAERPSVEALLDRIAPRLAQPHDAPALAEAIRQRRQHAGQIALPDGRTLDFATAALPDGGALLTFCGKGAEPAEALPSIDHAEIELMPFLTGIVRQREDAIEAKRLTLDLRGDRRSGTIMADEALLGGAIGGLIDEAIAATSDKGRILITLSRRRGAARITVAHSGQGIDPDPAVRRAIEAHGGQLDIGGDRNATATILLP
ncbi:PAS-domain containing protein [Altericroceibacterium xinjiangense]|uniref:PAS-domain containing protein n=1 Tax=Altericroceibacterium xinjiangense TaxID=762261 RepID=UPI000F7FA461|nr:PAS-domain containing protein [Altericroceibacterium xinjiangense]